MCRDMDLIRDMLLTTGGAPIEVIRRYIENQGRK